HDLGPRGDEAVDECVPQRADEAGLADEGDEVLPADELRLEEGPAGEREVERRDGRDDEEDDVDQRPGDVEPQRVAAADVRAAAARWRLVRGTGRGWGGEVRSHEGVLRQVGRVWGPGRGGGVPAPAVSTGDAAVRHQPSRPSCWACFLTS